MLGSKIYWSRRSFFVCFILEITKLLHNKYKFHLFLVSLVGWKFVIYSLQCVRRRLCCFCVCFGWAHHMAIAALLISKSNWKFVSIAETKPFYVLSVSHLHRCTISLRLPFVVVGSASPTLFRFITRSVWTLKCKTMKRKLSSRLNWKL